jgi:MoxR-like ATPase
LETRPANGASRLFYLFKGFRMTARDDIIALGKRIGQSIIGQEQMVERLLLGLLANGHLLVEGLPGLAKTRTINSLAKNLNSELSRVQFTADLLPADITGSEIYFSEAGKGEFKFQQGPIFANLILADEINRAPAKVQSALLEAMGERSWRRRTRSSRRAPIRFPKPSSTAS